MKVNFHFNCGVSSFILLEKDYYNVSLSFLLKEIYLSEIDFFMKEYQMELNNSSETFKKMSFDSCGGNKKVCNKVELGYMRCFDSFIMFMDCDKKEAEEFRYNFLNYLLRNLSLKIEMEKGVLSIYKSSFYFLGMEVKINNSYNCMKNEHYNNVTMKVNLSTLIFKFQSLGICTSKGEPMPCFSYYNLPHSKILENYNMILKNVYDEYSFVDNSSKLGMMAEWLLRKSCARLLASKFKLKRVTRVYKMFGVNMSCLDLSSSKKISFMGWDFLSKVSCSSNISSK
uniref:Domain X domain-containing protein n=1 Tax=Bryozoa sp. TaxID=2813608 RepID=A0AAU8L2S0_9BILA